MGRITTSDNYSSGVVSTIAYNADSQETSETDSSAQGGVSTTTFDYDLMGSGGAYNGAYEGGALVHSRTTSTLNGTAQPTTDTVNSYTWGQLAEQTGVSYTPNTAQSTVYATTLSYDASGHLYNAAINDGSPRQVSYVTNTEGEIISRLQTANSNGATTAWDYYYDMNDQQVVHVGNDAGATAVNVGDAYQPIGPTAQGDTGEADAGSTYTAQSGDTLQSIAAGLWGDASLWYMIADANGLDGSAPLQVGQTLTIPAKVVNLHNNASTFLAYNPSEAAPCVAKRLLRSKAINRPVVS